MYVCMCAHTREHDNMEFGGAGKGGGEVFFFGQLNDLSDELREGCRIHSLRSIGVSMWLMVVGMGAALEPSNVFCPWARVNKHATR